MAVIESTGNVYRELFEAIVEQSADQASALQDVFVGAAAVLEETDYIDPCPIGTVAREAANTSEPMRQAAQRAFASWIDAAARHLGQAGVAPDEAEQLATMTVATLEGCFILSRTRRDPTPLLTSGQLVARLASQAITAAERSRT